MSDLISRQAAIDAVKTYWKKVVDDIPEGVGSEELTQLCDMALEHNANILKAIDQLPSAQPERKRGKWIYGEDEYGIDGYHCDKCGFFVPWDYAHKFINYIEDYKFCPNCGADMRE